jgi:hypothetical protein
MSDYKAKMSKISELASADPSPDTPDGELLMSLADDVEVTEALLNVDGSVFDRVTQELISRGGEDAVLGRFLSLKIAEAFAEMYPD